MSVPIKILKKFNIENADKLIDNRSYNCWGFTRFVFERKYLVWEREDSMKVWLKTSTVKIKKPKIGDIGVMKDKFGLTHTFIVINSKQEIILHKPGPCPLTYGTLHKEVEGYGKIVEYRRFRRGG